MSITLKNSLLRAPQQEEKERGTDESSDYPNRNFLVALSIGRAIRYFAVGYAAHIYGHAITKVFSHYSRPILHTFIALVVLGAILGLIYLKWYRPRKKRQDQPQC
jgi:membrane protein DedA with SNARE-associated domain